MVIFTYILQYAVDLGGMINYGRSKTIGSIAR